MENKPLIIGLVGKAKSGKDTAARSIISCCETAGCDAVKKAFADPIRQIGEIFGFTEEVMTNQMLKEEWKHPIFSITPRKFMQMVGSDLFRNHLDKDCWVKLMECEIDRYKLDALNVIVPNPEDKSIWVPKTVIIISDVRFPNELEMIKKNDGLIVKIERTSGVSDGEWRQHESEKYIDELKYDTLWYNNELSAEEWMGTSLKCFGTLLRERNIQLHV